MQNADMIFRYPRVSPDAQDRTNQAAQLMAAGRATIFRVKISGAIAGRPELKKLVPRMTHGDVVIIPAVDRLSRDTTDLPVIARDKQRAGAGLHSLAEPFVYATSDFAELVLDLLGVTARLEPRRVFECTARGRADAKGVKCGRKPSLTPHPHREARKQINEREAPHSIARSCNVSQAMISRLSS